MSTISFSSLSSFQLRRSGVSELEHVTARASGNFVIRKSSRDRRKDKLRKWCDDQLQNRVTHRDSSIFSVSAVAFRKASRAKERVDPLAEPANKKQRVEAAEDKSDDKNEN